MFLWRLALMISLTLCCICFPTPLLIYSACYIRSTCVFLCPKQDFVVGIGCLVDCYQRSPVLCVVVFLQAYSLNLICLPWFCSALTCILIFLLSGVVMLTQMYANIWQKVWILMFLCSCSACVALPGVSLWSCQSGTCLAGDRGGSSANLEDGASYSPGSAPRAQRGVAVPASSQLHGLLLTVRQ